jgi:uncharacterized UBP type Zn finger protein
MAEVACTHLDRIEVKPPSAGDVEGCEECLKTGGQWVHLRVCLTCGKVGCCDSSPNRHASRHAAETAHPIVSSVEPGETWSWCYEDQIGFEVEFR